MNVFSDIFVGILVGGTGRRLGGVDKARLRLPRGGNLLQRLVHSVAPWVHSVVLAGRQAQTFPEVPCAQVVDHYPQAGPLGGLHALLTQAPVPWCWLIAVDMPRLSGDFLPALATARRPGVQIVVPRSPNGIDPCAGLYHRSLAPTVEKALGAQHLALRTLIARVPHAEVVTSGVQLTNINRSSDLVELSAS